MQSPLPTISLIILYILFVNYGPKFMKNRAPFEMKPLLFVFNAAIVVLYVYLTREVRVDQWVSVHHLPELHNLYG